MLRSNIRQFKATEVDVFSTYHNLEMGTMNWDMLDHLAEDIVRNGAIYLCGAGLYVYSHTLLKQSYDIQ